MNSQTPKIYLFHCSNSVDKDALRRLCGESGNIAPKTISLPCSGKVDLLYLLKAFETGADGVMLVTCNKGECQFLEGNLRAQVRAEAVDSLIEEIGLGKGRMVVVQRKDENGVEHIINELENLAATIKNMPQSAEG